MDGSTPNDVEAPGPARAAAPARFSLGWVVALNLGLAGAQILVGTSILSLALVSDGFHNLSDAAAAVVDLVNRPDDAEFLDDSRKHVSRSLLRIRSLGGVAGAGGIRRQSPRPPMTQRASGRDDYTASDVLSHPDSDRRPRTCT